MGVGLNFPNLIPGMQASRESVEKALKWRSVIVADVVLDSTTVDSRSTNTNELLPGLVLGKIASSKKYKNFDADNTDGSEEAVALLALPVNTKDSGGTAREQITTVVVSGYVKQADAGGLDAKARADLYPRVVFDDDLLMVNRRGGWRQVRNKTADYTVVVADSEVLFTNRAAAGAVNFTLPALGTAAQKDAARGVRFGFFIEADQTVTITAGTADTLVVFNDAAADSIAFSTLAEKVGAFIQVLANDDGSKWLVIVHLAAETQTPTIVT